jgi:hypothetical protein
LEAILDGIDSETFTARVVIASVSLWNIKEELLI